LLDDKLRQSLERTFRLLKIAHPYQDIHRVNIALTSKDLRARAKRGRISRYVAAPTRPALAAPAVPGSEDTCRMPNEWLAQRRCCSWLRRGHALKRSIAQD